jgi:hypothetical protein
MANLISAGTPFYGLFADAILSSTGAPVTSSPVTVYLTPDGTTEAGTATLYNGPTSSATSVSNPVSTDGYGNLTFWASPGYYILAFSVGGVATTKTVQIDPYYADSVWNAFVENTGAVVNPLSGDCKLCNASGGATGYTLPSPALGQRFKFVKTDTSANGIGITPPSGSIIAATSGNINSSNSYFLYARGQSLELFCDGTNFQVMGSQMPGVLPYGRIQYNGGAANMSTTSTWLPFGTAASWTIGGQQGGMAGNTALGYASLEVPFAGIYHCSGAVRFPANASFSGSSQVGGGVWQYSGSSGNFVKGANNNPSSSSPTTITIAQDVTCAALDNLAIAGYSTLSSQLEPDPAESAFTWMDVRLVSYGS